MPSPDDIQYAMETTRVLHEPDHRIQTFGETRFSFQLLTEPMDEVGKVRIRSGEVEAMKPRILRPDPYCTIELDGFDETARARFDALVEKFKDNGHNLAFLQYGFRFKRGTVHQELIQDSIEAVRERLLDDIRKSGNPSLAIIEGVDDTWEISILKFSFEMILRSHEINSFDLRRKGLI
jgi:hypothetical protein